MSRTGSSSSGEEMASRPPRLLKCQKTLSRLTLILAKEVRQEDVGRRRSEWALQAWNFLEVPESSHQALCFLWTMRMLIVVSVLGTLTQAAQLPASHKTNTALESAFDAIFLAEALLRFAVSPSSLVFLSSFCNVIDVVASVVPIALQAMMLLDLSQDRDLRVFLLCFVPALRLLKLLRHFEKFHLLLHAFWDALEALPVLLFTLGVVVLIFSALVYAVEPRSNVATLAEAAWFTVITISTVGYGDVYPVTGEGRLIVAVLAVCGTAYMSIPLGIVGNAFSSVWEDRDRLLLMQRARTRLVQSGYTKTEIPEIFELFDENADGVLSLPDFRAMLKSMKLGISDGRITDLFNLFDTDHSGTIDHEEFVRILFPRAFSELVGEVFTGPLSNLLARVGSVSLVCKLDTVLKASRSAAVTSDTEFKV